MNLVNNLKSKSSEFGFLRYGPEVPDNMKINKNPINELKLHFKEELKYLSDLFSIDENCALVLAALLLQYLHGETELYFISNDCLIATLSLNILEFYTLNSAISELQYRKIIEIKDLDYSVNNWIKKIQNLEYYREIEETAFIETEKKTYQLTETFINKIIYL